MIGKRTIQRSSQTGLPVFNLKKKKKTLKFGNLSFSDRSLPPLRPWRLLTCGGLLIGCTIRSLSSLKGSTGRSSWSSFREEAQKRHNRRIQELHEEEMERVERVRRMQSVFNRARNKSNRSYESWSEGGPGAYHQHFQRNDWYWKTDTSSRNQDSDFKEVPRASPNCVLSHHYSILGLDRFPTPFFRNLFTRKLMRYSFRKSSVQTGQKNEIVQMIGGAVWSDGTGRGYRLEKK